MSFTSVTATRGLFAQKYPKLSLQVAFPVNKTSQPQSGGLTKTLKDSAQVNSVAESLTFQKKF